MARQGTELLRLTKMPDPRTIEGELMCPALYPPERIAARKRDLLRDFQAQFQQNPTSEIGAHFHRPGCLFGRCGLRVSPLRAAVSGISRPRNSVLGAIPTGRWGRSFPAGWMGSIPSMML